jgi:hypothetical protein
MNYPSAYSWDKTFVGPEKRLKATPFPSSNYAYSDFKLPPLY